MPNVKRNAYEVTITETLEMTVIIKASDKDEAEQTVSDNWRNSEYILDADNFTGVSFKAELDIVS